MGVAFPFYALLLARFESVRALLFFSAGCIVAGLLVGLVSYGIGKRLLLGWIDERSRNLGELRRSGAVIDLAASRSLGEVSPNFTDFFTALDAELKGLKAAISGSEEAFGGLKEHFAATQAAMESLAESAEGGEGALSRLTALIGDAADRGMELAESGARVRAALETEERVYADLSGCGLQVEETQEALATLIQEENERNRSHQATVDSGELAFAELRRLQERIGAVLGMVVEIIRTMEDLAARSNILAMNASIEAARAGAAGKGFAVLASELRKQSEETAGRARNARENLAGLKDELRHGERSIVDAVEVFHILKEDAAKSDAAYRRMDELAEQFLCSGATLQQRMRSLGETFGKLKDLTDALQSAEKGFAALGTNEETELARNALEGMRASVASMGEERRALGLRVDRLASSAARVSLLVARFALLPEAS